MTATVTPPVTVPAALPPPARADGVELLGAFGGSGYRGGTYLVRRGDRQTLQLTPLLFHLLAALDGETDPDGLAAALSEATGRQAGADDVRVLLGKLADLGLLAGTEPDVVPAPSPLLALRWKVVVSDPRWTRRLTAPFAVLFRPWIVLPVLVAFAAVCWFVLVDKGLASATSRAFDSPGLLLGVFALAVASAGFHELGHGAACRYGGAEPGNMGAGLYLVYPAFYTDVSDAYRLDRRGRLRVDLGGLYFNALVAVAVTAVWLVLHNDVLLLLVAMQLLQMVRQLSPVIRADGYHILADLTGVPDLFAHIGPTLRGLLPWRWRERSALTGRARLLVTAWVLVVVPVLVSLLVGAVVVLPRLLASAWMSSGHRLHELTGAAGHGSAIGVGAALLQLLALALPLVGSALIATRLVRTTVAKVLRLTAGRPIWRGLATAAGVAAVVAGGWALWPSGQYQPVRPTDRGTVGALFHTVAYGRTAAPQPTTFHNRLGLVLVPAGGATAAHPALLVVPDEHGGQTAVLSNGAGAVEFPFTLPTAPGPGDQQALATNTHNGSVVYDLEYGLVTVAGRDPVTSTNSAFALASCRSCTTVAVSFQVVLVVGQVHDIAPIDAAVAANRSCPSCLTTALADQLVVTLRAAPSAALQQQLHDAIAKLAALRSIDPRDTATIEADIAAVQHEVQTLLDQSGLEVNPSATPTPTSTGSAPSDASATTSATTTGQPSSTPISPTASPPTSPPPSTSAPEPSTTQSAPKTTSSASPTN